jgi:hypothetical protein
MECWRQPPTQTMCCDGNNAYALMGLLVWRNLSLELAPFKFDPPVFCPLFRRLFKFCRFMNPSNLLYVVFRLIAVPLPFLCQSNWQIDAEIPKWDSYDYEGMSSYQRTNDMLGMALFPTLILILSC